MYQSTMNSRFLYSARAPDGPQEMERNLATAKHVAWPSCSWLLLRFFPYPVGHPEHEHCTVPFLDTLSRFLMEGRASLKYSQVKSQIRKATRKIVRREVRTMMLRRQHAAAAAAAPAFVLSNNNVAVAAAAAAAALSLPAPSGSIE